VKDRALGRTTGRILFGRLWTCRQTLRDDVCASIWMAVM